MTHGIGQVDAGGGGDAAAALRPCPACGGRTRLEAHRVFVWVCGACGAPRVPVDEPDPALAAPLGRARVERAAALGWRAGAVVLGLTAAMALGLAALLAMASQLAAGVLAGVAALVVALAVLAISRARGHDDRVREALDDAWELAAERLLGAGASALSAGGLSAVALARAMRTDEGHAERLLASLAARGRARIEVGDDAELRYRIAREDAQGMAEDGPIGAAAARTSSSEPRGSR